MIPRTELIWHTQNTDRSNWQQALKNLVRDPAELFQLLSLNSDEMPAHLAACEDFALRVPRGFVDKMVPGDWQDPLLLQVLPQAIELADQPGFIHDPLQEKHSNPHTGLIHKYQGRVLLVASGSCAINCRYCFRRHFPYEENNPSLKQWRQTLGYIANDSSIHEVILSGGDPLVINDKQLTQLVQLIADIPHVTTLRIHSRLPLVLPERIDGAFIKAFTDNRLNHVFVIHCNHPNELDGKVGLALSALKKAGVTLLNQSVLLANINDKSHILQSLSEKLFSHGVLPYYLHLLDKVQGAAHFEVTENHAKQLIESLLARLPGYLIPKLVTELPEAPSKTPL